MMKALTQAAFLSLSTEKSDCKIVFMLWLRETTEVWFKLFEIFSFDFLNRGMFQSLYSFTSTVSPTRKIRLDQMTSPTLQSQTAMASEAFTMKTLGTMSLMYDKDDVNYMCVLQY